MVTEKDAIVVEKNVMIPMQDGTRLHAEIFRPRAAGRYPVLVERTGYDLTGMVYPSAEYFARHGYVYVAQHVRGRYGSEGEFRPFRDDGWGANRDGYDTVEWAAAQPWSNGDVGMAGGSYSGLTQYLTAPARPPHLKTLLVRAGPAGVREIAFRGGAYQRHLQCDWGLRHGALLPLGQGDLPPELAAARDRALAAYGDLPHWFRHLPLNSFPPLEGLAGWWFDWIEHPEEGPYWDGVDVTRHFAEFETPILHLGGWFDLFLDSTLRCFNGIRQEGRGEACRAGQRLIIGPWIHTLAELGKRVVGELDFGPNAEIDRDSLRLEWYDRWLKGSQANDVNKAPVQIFLMGANRWLDFNAWPPQGVEYQPLYLRAGSGRSEGSLNNGGLSFEPPDASDGSDAFSYDPETPVPSLLLYPQFGPRDHRPIEGRTLTYTTAPLSQDLTVIGPVKTLLYGSSSAPDTDWVVRLCDVWPDGRSMSVCDGILRARYRNSFEHGELITPGEVYEFEVDLWATAQVFRAGHRLRVDVTSSDFPRYARNLNTGGSCADETVSRVAVNHIFHDPQHASRLLLPHFRRA